MATPYEQLNDLVTDDEMIEFNQFLTEWKEQLSLTYFKESYDSEVATKLSQ